MHQLSELACGYVSAGNYSNTLGLGGGLAGAYLGAYAGACLVAPVVACGMLSLMFCSNASIAPIMMLGGVVVLGGAYVGSVLFESAGHSIGSTIDNAHN
jgi:hypothetical protein